MKGLSPKQAWVLEHLRRAWRLEGGQPSLRGFAAELGIAYATLRQHLDALDRKGFVSFSSRGHGKAPALRLVGGGVPVVGDIPAGSLGEAIEHPEGYLSLPGRGDRFGLRVKGDSMADVIREGDVVILRRDRSPRSGEVCAVRVDGSDTTLKYLDLSAKRDSARLRPHNPDYPTVTVEMDRVRVDGVFAALLRGEIIGELFEEASV